MVDMKSNTLHLSKYDNPKWAVVSKDGMVIFLSIKYKRTDSINAFMSVWDKKKPAGKWRYWKRRGYSCQRITLNVEPHN